MVFNSIPFLLFITLFLLLWPVFNKKNQSRWLFLTFASLFFYGWWDWRFLFLIIGSGLIDYWSGLYIPKVKHKKLLLIISLVANLGALSIFKYSVFFAESFEGLMLFFFNSNVNLVDSIPEFALILPVGISFYTFQSMSYTIDIYRGRLKPTSNIFHFFSFLTMFPQLVAGPIVRAKDILIQLNQKRVASDLQKWHGIKLFVFGLFQKTVLADNIGEMVSKAYSLTDVSEYGVYWWLVLIGFAFQIYCDFSGYSMMARGIAKFMGYHFKMNFNHPYLSSSFKLFWSAWHISLSTWFRDYVYIPLGGSRKGVFVGLGLMMLTMLLSGLWHGAGLSFLVWGGLHGFYLALERLFKLNRLNKLVYGVFVFLAVVFAWNFFRADSLTQALAISEQLFSANGEWVFYDKFFNSMFFLMLAVLIEGGILLFKIYPRLNYRLKAINFDVILVAMALVSSLFLRGVESEFIYFQF
jgi:alginate O-acetyltransferase complex protein AlgI